jgi:Zn-dependent peptidase ImmA (M78 family)
MYAKEILEKAEQFCNKHGVEQPPVKIIELCKREGIKVFEQYLPRDVSGFIVIQKENFENYGTGKLIVVNLTDNANRRRFTIAHELAHYILHKDETEEYYAHRDAGQNGGIEREANLFASSILMPRALIETAVKEYRACILGSIPTHMLVEHIAQEFVVSKDAAQIRLYQMKEKP